ncbi:MAG TPA: hypothetical protein VHI52_08395 [Verrucomicrobiae bacterium]|nr:hypothetical protein [Verrucomicrobiae bacterium]
MRALILQREGRFSVGVSGAIWLAAFLSPTAYLLLVAVWNRSQMPAVPQGLIVGLFCIVPVVALLVCGLAVRRAELKGSLRVAWVLMTVLAMAVQITVLLGIVVSAITAAIALPQ